MLTSLRITDLPYLTWLSLERYRDLGIIKGGDCSAPLNPEILVRLTVTRFNRPTLLIES